VAVIDRRAIERLVSTCGEGGEVMVAALLETFLDDAPRQIAVLRRGLSEANADDVRRAAHTLRSQCETFGATLIVPLAGDLEARGREGRLDDTDALVDDLQAEYDRAAKELHALRLELQE
jgi:HPt (histidine-containing phosphotransfer) domain-containing protein